MGREQQAATCDLTVAVEFIMTAIQGLTMGRSLDDPQVQQGVNWAIRKMLPLDNQFRNGALSPKAKKAAK